MTFQKTLLFSLITFYILHTATAQEGKIVIRFNENKTAQTIDNFGASDAWACQFVGNWPDAKKNAIADWLFSMDTLQNGSPGGIGLSLWRYNLGAGSAEQADSSGIKDEWRRASLTSGNSNKVQAQNWFLSAAKQRGVQQFLGFFNSPPVQLTNNGKAYADKGICNIDSTAYKTFADYTVKAIEDIRKATGVTFNYISPVNEPQWEWSDGGQEGCPYNNSEISALVKAFDNSFQQKNVQTKVLISESGDLKYLLPANDKKDKDDQIRDFFHSASGNYIGNLSNVSKIIAAHSYFTTSPQASAAALRNTIKDSINLYKDLAYWQSEYCILGDNAGEINGNKRDTGITAALYLARVINNDLTKGNATAWQWWTAISAYDYKDGLIYIDKNKTDGKFYDSKMLWAMGNYSRFIRPGMKRIEANANPAKDLYSSGFKGAQQLVWVLVNTGDTAQAVSFDNTAGESKKYKPVTYYITNNGERLGKHVIGSDDLQLPPKSIVTVILQ